MIIEETEFSAIDSEHSRQSASFPAGQSEHQAVRLSLVPPIRRARGYRLYTADNRRLLDLWQYGGRALLGHNPPGVLRELKNTAERGLFAPLPSHLEGRFLKALAQLFPGCSFRLFSTEASLRRALTAAGFADAPFPDPALSTGEALFSSEAPPLWRPFLADPAPAAAIAQTAALSIPAAASTQTASAALRLSPVPAAPLFIPALPLPWTGAPWVLALNGAEFGSTANANGLAERLLTGEILSQGDILSPVVLAAAARCVYDLIATPAPAPFPKIKRALTGGNSAGERIWQRRGIYLFLRENPGDDRYTVIFRRFLDAGFLLPPSPQEALILPALMSAGEEAKLASLLQGPLPG
ncbi:hypothetical protein FACS189483_07940 [Spirochaetia bacterium]|nr:hypothetical protein FACS189483_07940 [Spirochaetia bacterium]